MTLLEFSNGIMDALEKYDSEILPLGLYSSDELVENNAKKPHFKEWQGALLPYLQLLGCSVISGYIWKDASYQFNGFAQLPDIGGAHITIVKYSNIKVRQYGSGYQVDKHESRPERWQKLNLKNHIQRVWKRDNETQILIFIAFDKSQRPLEHELSGLQHELNWEKKDVLYLTRGWPDKAKRGFGVKLAIWARSAQAS